MTKYLNTQYILLLNKENSGKKFFFSFFLYESARNAMKIPNHHWILFLKYKIFDINKVLFDAQ